MGLEMGKFASNRARMYAAFTVAALAAFTGVALRTPNGPVINGWVRASYDTLHSLYPGGSGKLTNYPVVIVYLDLPSYGEQDPAQPWPRELHAQLLNRLSASKARAVVFDIVFGGAGPDAAGDASLVEAIRRNGRVILAAEYNEAASHFTSERSSETRTHTLKAPYEPFSQVAAGWGIASQIIDDDFMVRRYLAGFPSASVSTLTWATANWLQLPITQPPQSLQRANEWWIRYYGPPLTIPNVSYREALDPAGVPPGFFSEKIVFVGARQRVAQFFERQDEFRNPFHSWLRKGLFMPGVEVHATEMLNLVQGDWLRRLTPLQETMLLTMCALLVGGLVWVRPIPAAGLALAGAGLTLLLALFGFARGFWFPWLIVSAAQIPLALGSSVLFHSIEWYRARRRFEAKIRQQAALIDKAHDAILVQNLEGAIVYANPSAERLYGWTLAALQSDGAAKELFAPEATAATSARAIALSQGEWNGELRLHTRDGRVITVESRWTLIRDESELPKALLLINTDITEKKQLEAQFLRIQRMNTIGSLAGGMAHDLNNALAPVLMGVQLLRRKARDEESRQLLSLVEENTHRGANMVRQVLLFTRGRGSEFERVQLGPLVAELKRMVTETFPKNINVEAFAAQDLWPVRGNSTELHQILLNLCVNARDAMGEGGTVSLAVDNVELTAKEAAEIPEARPGQFVLLLVSDTGAGIPPEVRARIFEPFFTTKADGRGTGIGLATVLRIVKSHGGFLRLESEPGQGTTFEIFLPKAVEVPAGAETATPVITSEAENIPRGHGEVILIADDERAIRDLLADSLVEQGYRVLTAANGEEAIKLFQTHGSEIRLLITDNAMPVMDGPRVIHRLRELRPDLPVILATGENRVDAIDRHANVEVVGKPFSLEEMLNSINRALIKSKKTCQ
jgi:PAS domain S-box-containing protein